MMKNLSDSEKGNLLGLLLPISSKGSIPQIEHHMELMETVLIKT